MPNAGSDTHLGFCFQKQLLFEISVRGHDILNIWLSTARALRVHRTPLENDNVSDSLDFHCIPERVRNGSLEERKSACWNNGETERNGGASNSL